MHLHKFCNVINDKSTIIDRRYLAIFRVRSIALWEHGLSLANDFRRSLNPVPRPTVAIFFNDPSKHLTDSITEHTRVIQSPSQRQKIRFKKPNLIAEPPVLRIVAPPLHVCSAKFKKQPVRPFLHLLQAAECCEES